MQKEIRPVKVPNNHPKQRSNSQGSVVYSLQLWQCGKRQRMAPDWCGAKGAQLAHVFPAARLDTPPSEQDLQRQIHQLHTRMTWRII